MAEYPSGHTSAFCEAACLSPQCTPACQGGDCLIEGARRGDRRAQERVFALLYLPVRRQALRLCRDGGAADDLTQDSLLRVLEKLPQLQDTSRLLGWTWRVVLNTHRMSVRRGKFAPRETLALPESLAAEPAAGPFERLAGRRLAAEISPMMRSLPETLAVVFRLRAVECLSTEQTASRLSISREAVRTRLRRARGFLRQSLSRG
jgi:RNA polymerase sigma-70 factor, ECF subfamily